MSEHKFCIKKIAGSVMSPWLSRMKDGTLVYSNLEDLISTSVHLIRFSSKESAETFIKEHPEDCDARCVVHTIQFETTKVEISTA